MKLFSERIARRHELWWRSFSGPHHRPDACRRPLGRDADEADWRCCPLWQRKLSHKWTAREFAARHGVAVPELLWSGRDPGQLPLRDLPPRFAIRPTKGHASIGVLVLDDGRDMLTGRRYGPRRLRRALAATAATQPDGNFLMAEAFVPRHDGAAGLPDVWKVQCFGGSVATIQRQARQPGRRGLRRVTLVRRDDFDPDWRWRPDLRRTPHTGEAPAPPVHRDELLDVAARLGAAAGTFIRVDLYDAPSGVVFGEFTSTPGLTAGFSPVSDAFLGECWERWLGDAP